MSDINIGDRVAVYIIDCDGNTSRLVLTVIDTYGDKIVFDSGFYHRKQCRKLVKVRKCDACEGSGQYIPPYEPGTSIMDVYLICQECNGTGKVKKND